MSYKYVRFLSLCASSQDNALLLLVLLLRFPLVLTKALFFTAETSSFRATAVAPTPASPSGWCLTASACSKVHPVFAMEVLPRDSPAIDANRVGNVAPGEILFAKKYINEDHSSFYEVCHLFLKEAKIQQVPVACVLACAGPILNNSVE